MKRLEYSSIDLLDTDGDGESDDDWFNQDPSASPAQDFASVIVAQQRPDGSWPATNYGDTIICTAWDGSAPIAQSYQPPLLDARASLMNPRANVACVEFIR